MQELLKAMQDSIANSQKLAICLQNAATYANNITREAEAKIKSASETEAKNVIKEKELSDREDKVSKIENIVKIEEAGRAMKMEFNSLSEKLANDTLSFNKYRGDSLKELAAISKKNAEDKVELDKAWVSYKKREADLKAREEDYKERIARNIIKGVEGK